MTPQQRPKQAGSVGPPQTRDGADASSSIRTTGKRPVPASPVAATGLQHPTILLAQVNLWPPFDDEQTSVSTHAEAWASGDSSSAATLPRESPPPCWAEAPPSWASAICQSTSVRGRQDDVPGPPLFTGPLWQQGVEATAALTPSPGEVQRLPRAAIPLNPFDLSATQLQRAVRAREPSQQPVDSGGGGGSPRDRRATAWLPIPPSGNPVAPNGIPPSGNPVVPNGFDKASAAPMTPTAAPATRTACGGQPQPRGRNPSPAWPRQRSASAQVGAGEEGRRVDGPRLAGACGGNRAGNATTRGGSAMRRVDHAVGNTDEVSRQMLPADVVRGVPGAAGFVPTIPVWADVTAEGIGVIGRGRVASGGCGDGSIGEGSGMAAGACAAKGSVAAQEDAAAASASSVTLAQPPSGVVRSGNAVVPTAAGNASIVGVEWEVDTAELRFEELLGSGSTAEVFRGSWHGTDVAVKRLRRSGPLSVEFTREISVLLRLRHPNLVLFMGACTQAPKPLIVSEYCSGGTVFALLHQRRDTALSWAQRLKVAIDVAKGMNFLHRRQVVHRDLKSLNLLLVSQVIAVEDVPQVKVSDFGLSRAWSPPPEATGQACMTSGAGTYHWMAPEVLDGHSYDEKVDVYSYGICLFELISRRIPYDSSGLEPVSIAVAVSKGRRPDTTYLPVDCPADLRFTMECCWAHCPTGRPGFDTILETLKVANSL
eukprot:TRINITY_DN18775_c0_g1_i1.p1 TRINITY_DN18775_c0_g1~~TRINITY_DN18775_c0_g1_i1.p1  ORF type:complete len:829 (+),score=130.79 TRINITY_DN18775_c0_g1_i1:360-2489(+)